MPTFIPPRKNTLIGITHTREGVPIIQEKKVLKVGIGLPRGKAADVYVDPDGTWIIRQGNVVGSTGKLKFETVARVKTKADAEIAFRKAYDAADLCNYPRKVPYFVFTRPIMGKDGAEVYIPDFNATEAYSFADKNHVGSPTEIDVVFLEDEPFNGAFAMWSSSELRCTGDGLNALRSVAMYESADKVPEPFRESWKAAKETGDRTFGIAEGCWSCNCPFAKEANGKPSLCKPSGDLKFQLSRNIRVGGTAFFHTSGFRSIKQIFSAVERIKDLTGGRIAGIPLKMVLGSHKTNHNGQPAIQQNISLEFRAEDMESVRKNLIEQAWQFRAAAGLPPAGPRLIESSPAEAEESPMSAKAMVDEFYADTDESDDAPVTTNAPATQQASAAKITSIGEKLEKVKPQATPVQATPVQATPVQATPVQATPASESPVQVTPSQNTPVQPNTEPVAPSVPWSDRKGMTSALLQAKNELGDAEFSRILSAHGIMLGSAKFDDPKVLACYLEMKTPKVEQAGADEKPLF